MLRNKYAPHMIKDHNLVPNKEAHLGAIQQRKFQALLWWTKDFHHCGIASNAAPWATSELTRFITQINIESPS